MDPIVCSECGGKFQRGFIVETGRSEGETQKDWLGLLQMKGKQAFYITAFRCESCGFLKLYADINIPTDI